MRRLLGQSRLGEMLGEQFGLRLDDVGKAGFEEAGDLRVKFLPSAAQQARIGDIAHQRVLE